MNPKLKQMPLWRDANRLLLLIEGLCAIHLVRGGMKRRVLRLLWLPDSPLHSTIKCKHEIIY